MSNPTEEPEGLQNKSKLWALMIIDSEFDDACLSLRARGVYVHLCRRADKAHVAWPGIRSIAETIRVNRKTVIAALRELEERGFIKIVKQEGRPSNYEILPRHCWQPANQYLKRTGPKEVPVPKTDWTSTYNGPPPVPKTDPKVSIEGIPIKEPTARVCARARRAKLAADVSLLSLPLFLQGTDFLKALQDFIDHRKLSRRPMTQAALLGLVRDCEKWGKEAAILNIYYSIKRGWQGVFPPKPEPRPPKDRDNPRSCL